MTEIRLCASVICTALISFGVIQMLLPEGNTYRVAQTVFGVATILAIVLPIANGIKAVDWSASDNMSEVSLEMEHTVANQMQNLSAPLVESAIADSLESIGINPSQIDVEMDISESGGISIKYVRIKDVSEDDTEQVRDVLLRNFCVEPDKVEAGNG